MAKVKYKYESLLNALTVLLEAIENFKKLEELDKNQKVGFLDYEDAQRALRDSLIQRFEFTSDLFWKYLKIYLEEVINTTLTTMGPTPVIKAACNARLLSEPDSEILIEMIKQRNLISHMYKEEMADIICTSIPKYYELMKKYTEKLLPPN